MQESIYEKFMERALKRTEAVKLVHRLDPTTMLGAQASNDQLEKILSYFDIGKKEGAKVHELSTIRFRGALFPS